jgi:hypothetical protein
MHAIPSCLVCSVHVLGISVSSNAKALHRGPYTYLNARPCTHMPTLPIPPVQDVCRRIWPKLLEPAELEPTSSTGQPAFDAEGRVQGELLQQELQKDSATMAKLSHCFMTSQEYQQSEVAPAVLPIARQDQRQSTTTSASIMVHKGPCHELLALSTDSNMLWETVQGIKARYEQDGYTNEEEFMKVGSWSCWATLT